MISTAMFSGVFADGARTLHASTQAHPANAIGAAAGVAAPRKRRAAAGTVAASVRGLT